MLLTSEPSVLKSVPSTWPSCQAGPFQLQVGPLKPQAASFQTPVGPFGPKKTHQRPKLDHFSLNSIKFGSTLKLLRPLNPFINNNQWLNFHNHRFCKVITSKQKMLQIPDWSGFVGLERLFSNGHVVFYNLNDFQLTYGHYKH